MTRVWVLCCCVAACLTSPIVVSASARIVPPHFRHPVVTIKYLYVDAAVHVWNEIRSTGLENSNSSARPMFNFRQPVAASAPARHRPLLLRALKQVPYPKPYGIARSHGIG